MTYVELIVVLCIFSVISSMVIFNYGSFQARVNIKNLASDIALQIVQAQKSSLSGLLPPLAQQSLVISGWKPSYGVYFNPISNNKSFIYFTDLNNDIQYDGSNCIGVGECLNKITITKNNSISGLNVFYQGDSIPHNLNDLTITFSRPNSGAIMRSSTTFTSSISYIQINIVSPSGATAAIKLYPSGRVQIN